jgi:hypothetical protein
MLLLANLLGYVVLNNNVCVLVFHVDRFVTKHIIAFKVFIFFPPPPPPHRGSTVLLDLDRLTYRRFLKLY